VHPESLNRAEDCKVANIEAATQISARRVVYDECTIRMMFIEMDANVNGTVSKEEFINYLRSRPELQNTMCSALKSEALEKDEGSSKISPQIARVMGNKRIVSLYKDIDTNRNGVLTWDEFLDFFRRKSLLLGYSTPDNPRDRMAVALGSEYQQRVSQKSARKLTIARPEGNTYAVVEGWTSKFVLDQKEQQLNTQWAAERLSQLQEQSLKRRDPLSIAEDSIDEMKKLAQLVVGRPAKKVESVLTPEARQIVNKYTQNPADRSKSQSPKQPANQPETTITEDGDASKPLPAATPRVQPKSPALRLPSLMQPLVSDAGNPGCKGCKSPFSRKGRSCSIVHEKTPSSTCQVQEISPKKTPRSRTGKGGSRSPNKRGRTPRRSQRALKTDAVCQSSFGF